MKNIRVGRWFAAGVAGALFSALMLVTAGSVAADGLTQPVPGQDAQSPVQVVTTPGYTNVGAVSQPINAPSGGVPVYNYNGVVYTPSLGYTPGVVYPGQVYNPATCGTVACTAYGYYGGTYGYTAAGPVVGVNSNGVIVVQNGGNDDTYIFDPKTGKYVASDVYGNPEK